MTGHSPDRPADVPVSPTPAGPVRRRLRELPTIAVLAVLAIGLLGVSLNHWRKGLIVMGAAPLLAAVLRLLLPTREVQLLAVRSRGFDVALMLTVGAAVVALAYVVPPYYHHR